MAAADKLNFSEAVKAVNIARSALSPILSGSLIDFMKRYPGARVTVLAEASGHNAPGVRAVRLDVPGNEMEGCVHRLRDTCRKRSSLELISILRDCHAVRERMRGWLR